MNLPRVEVRHLNDIPAGQWALFQRHEPASSYVCVIVRCPVCVHLMTLSKRVHEVGPEGGVTPSLVCWGVDLGKCSWHVSVRLLGWDPSIARTE